MTAIIEIYGPQVLASEQIHAEKHRHPGETFPQAMRRIASALKDNDHHEAEFYQAILNMRFAPGGRVQSAIGSPHNITAYNCFVSGRIEDSFVDGPGSIMQRATEAATTLRMGGGNGYNFSSLRPRGWEIKGIRSNSSGPLSFIEIFNGIGNAANSAGNRNGAQMGVLNIDHPDIYEFIEAKQNPDRFRRFNFSMGVWDDFMEAKYAGKTYWLKWGDQKVKEIDPAELWDEALRSTWDWGEPGVLFLDTINRMNPLYYCEYIDATNPCGEQPLPPNGACLLGSFNLTRYISQDAHGQFYFRWGLFVHDIPFVVRAMDNVIDRTRYPLPAQEQEAKSKRRMGLGIMGLANAAEALGFPYGSPRFLDFEAEVLDTLRDHAYVASAWLAAEKGSFPLYDADLYSKGEFFKTLSPWTQDHIKRFGLRNSHLLSIAPTGTLAFTHDNISSSIEPVTWYEQERDVQTKEGKKTVILEDYGHRVFGVKGKLIEDVTIDEHLNVLAIAAARVDSAVSKTCNVSPNMPWDEFKKVYDHAWELNCKGITTFNPGGKRMGILRAKEQKEETVAVNTEGSACTFDPISGRTSCE